MGIGINQTEPTVHVAEVDGEPCTNVDPGTLTLGFRRAKTFGAHTQVGSGWLDVSRYASYKV